MTLPQISLLQHTLEDIARQHIADSVSVWPHIQARLSSPTVKNTRRSMRLIWTIALLLAALLLITTVAYAIYRIMADPGLQTVNDAGLVTDLNLAATPAPVLSTASRAAINLASSATRSASAAQPAPVATALAAQQIDDIAVTLNWAYADESRVALGLTIRGLQPPAGVKSHFLINAITLSDDQGTFFGRDGTSQTTEMQPDEPDAIEVTVINYQPLPADQTLHLNVDVKLGDTTVPMIPSAPTPHPIQMTTIAPLGDFHLQFDLPVYQALVIKPDQSIAAHGLTIRLDELRLSPSLVEARLCYQLPDPSDWQLESHVQIGSSPIVSQTGSSLTTDKSSASNSDDERCVTVDYPASYLNGTDRLTLTVDALVTSLPEVIAADAIARANAGLAAQGVVFDYRVQDHGAQLIVIQKPAAMSDLEANQRAFQALAQAAEKYVLGPWVFVVNTDGISK